MNGYDDSFIDYTFATSGTYVVRVVLPPDRAPRFDAYSPDRFTLHLSVEGHAVDLVTREQEPNNSKAFPQDLDGVTGTWQAIRPSSHQQRFRTSR